MNHQVLVFYLQADRSEGTPGCFQCQVFQHPIWGRSGAQVLNGRVLCFSQDCFFASIGKNPTNMLVDPWFIGSILDCRLNSLLFPALVLTETKSVNPSSKFQIPGTRTTLKYHPGQRAAVASRAVRASLSLREVVKGDNVEHSWTLINLRSYLPVFQDVPGLSGNSKFDLWDSLTQACTVRSFPARSWYQSLLGRKPIDLLLFLRLVME